MSGRRWNDVRLSVLDTSPIVEGSTPRQALRNTADLAVLADELGYYRYWVAEHHGMRGVASTAPAVMVGHLANATRRLRVGAGGVLLPNHAPLVVAEQFATLAALHPGRIDLGLGRAPGGPGAAVDAVRLGGEGNAKSFPQQLDELHSYLNPPENPRVIAVPALGGNLPVIWLLGSSTSSAQLAGERGLPYAFAHHLNPDVTVDAARAYRERFHASTDSAKPQILVSVCAIAAEDDERAEWLAGSIRLKTLSRVHGRRILLPSPEDAAAYLYTDNDRAEIAAHSRGVLVGSPDTLIKRLQALLDQTGADELMVTTPLYYHPHRRRSYELMASIAGRLEPGNRRHAPGSPMQRKAAEPAS